MENGDELRANDPRFYPSVSSSAFILSYLLLGKCLDLECSVVYTEQQMMFNFWIIPHLTMEKNLENVSLLKSNAEDLLIHITISTWF